MVMCPDHPGLTFNLSLVRTEPTYNQPIQQWTFVSDFAVSERSCFLFVNLLISHLNFDAIQSPLSGAGLLWHIHGQTAPVYVPSQPGVHHPPRLQPKRASDFRHGHPISAGAPMIPCSIESIGKNRNIYRFILLTEN